MHLLPISLLAILAGTLLLAKTKKEELGKFFTIVSWFFVVVGFILFIGVICVETNKGCHSCCQQEMIKSCPHGVHQGMCCPVHGMGCSPAMHEGKCCSAEKQKGCGEKKDNCAKSDSTMTPCTKHTDDSKAPAK